MNSVSS